MSALVVPAAQTECSDPLDWWLARVIVRHLGDDYTVIADEPIQAGRTIWQIPRGLGLVAPGRRFIHTHGIARYSAVLSASLACHLGANAPRLPLGDPILHLAHDHRPVVRWNSSSLSYVAIRSIRPGRALTCDFVAEACLEC